MRHFHLTRPRLDFYVDATVHERDGRFMAAADLAEDWRMMASVTRRWRP